MKQRIQKVHEFIQYDLWRQPHATTRDPKKRLGYRVLQTIILVGRSFKDKALNIRANSLSFSLLFAFVPMVAGVFAIARGFGFEELIKEHLSTSFLAEANIAPMIIDDMECEAVTLFWKAIDQLYGGIALDTNHDYLDFRYIHFH